MEITLKRVWCVKKLTIFFEKSKNLLNKDIIKTFYYKVKEVNCFCKQLNNKQTKIMSQ